MHFPSIWVPFSIWSISSAVDNGIVPFLLGILHQAHARAILTVFHWLVGRNPFSFLYMEVVPFFSGYWLSNFSFIKQFLIVVPKVPNLLISVILRFCGTANLNSISTIWHLKVTGFFSFHMLILSYIGIMLPNFPSWTSFISIYLLYIMFMNYLNLKTFPQSILILMTSPFKTACLWLLTHLFFTY